MKVYVHGNCQSTAVRQHLQETFTDWTINNREIHLSSTHASRSAFEEDIKSADVIISQPISRNYMGHDWLSTEGVAAIKRQSTPLVKFPSMFFRGHHPSYFYLGSGLGRFEGAKAPYHDLLIAEAVLSGEQYDALHARLSSIHHMDAKFIAAEISLAVEELRKRELALKVECPVSAIIEEQACERLLFNTIDHPKRIVTAKLTSSILAILGYNTIVDEDGPDCIPYPVLPVTPALANFLSSKIDGDFDGFVASNVVLSFDAYLRECFEYYARMPAKELASYLYSSTDGCKFLTRFRAHTGKRIRDSAQAEVYFALYRILLDRDGHSKEIAGHLARAGSSGHEAVIKSFFCSAEFSKRRSIFLRNLGVVPDAAEAIDAA